MGIQLESDIEEDLREWGKWARSCPSRALKYPSSQPYTVLKGSDGLRITEERALEIDAAISRLFGRDREVRDLLILHYVWGFTYRAIEERTDYRRTKISQIIDTAKGWLGGYLIGQSA